MKPIVLFSSLAALCAAGLLALSYQGWRDDDSVVTALNSPAGSAVQTVSGDTSSASPQPSPSATQQTTPPASAPAGQDQVAAVQPAQPPAAADATQPAAAGEPATGAAAATAIAPTFDMVRVEEDGSAVLAGRAEPGATVTALLDGKPIGEEVVNERGEWVIVPTVPVPPGAHQMTLQQTLPSGGMTTSDQAVAFTVPDQPGTQPLIVLSEATKPSRVLQKPDAPASDAAAKSDAPVAGAPAPDAPDTKVAAVEPGAAANPSASDAAAPAAPAATDQPAQAPVGQAATPADRNLNLDVVDYDASGRTTFSGTAKPGSKVRVYVGSQYAGEAATGDDGRWNLTAQNEIAAGTYALRADAVGSDGKVAERIEMPFLRESPERVAALQQQRQAGTATGNAQDSGAPAQPPVQTGETQQAAGQASEPAPAEPQVAAAPQAQPETATVGVQSATSGATVQSGESTQASGQSAQVAAAPAQGTGAAPAAGDTAAAAPNQPGKVVIQPGNNLWQISRVIYGKGVQYTVIYDANKEQIRDPDLIYPGQIFETPGSQAPQSIDPSCRKPLAECKAMQEQAGQGTAQ